MCISRHRGYPTFLFNMESFIDCNKNGSNCSDRVDLEPMSEMLSEHYVDSCKGKSTSAASLPCSTPLPKKQLTLPQIHKNSKRGSNFKKRKKLVEMLLNSDINAL